MIARAAEAGDHQPRLIVSGDGGSTRPAVVSSAAPLAPKSENSDFMPRLLAAGDGRAPAVRPLGSGPLVAPSGSAAPADFLPRLVSGDEVAPSARPARPPRPVPAAATPEATPDAGEAPPAGSDEAGPGTDPV